MRVWMAKQRTPTVAPSALAERGLLFLACSGVSVMRRSCVLAMDHHCPWFNNCIGHQNHRYFFLFMLYMWVGVLYIISVSYGPYSARAALRKVCPLPPGVWGCCPPYVQYPSSGSYPLLSAAPPYHHLDLSHVCPQELRREGRMRDFREELEAQGLPANSGQLSFLFILCSAVAFSLGILLFW